MRETQLILADEDQRLSAKSLAQRRYFFFYLFKRYLFYFLLKIKFTPMAKSYVINKFDSLFSISYDHVVWLLYSPFFVHKKEREKKKIRKEKEKRMLRVIR